VWFVAFVGTLLLGAFKGVILAMSISLVIIIYAVVEPEVSVLAQREDGDKWVALARWPDAKEHEQVLVFRVEGPLFYANCELLHDRVEEHELDHANNGKPVRAVVLSAASVSFVDSTAMQVLKDMAINWKKRGIRFYVASAYGTARESFERSLLSKLDQDDLTISIDDCISLYHESRAQTGRMESRLRRRSIQRELPMIDFVPCASPPA